MKPEGGNTLPSILNTIKLMLGIGKDYKHFDKVIIQHINAALMILTQIGVGPPNGFSIKGPGAKWSDFLTDMSKLEAVKTYIYLRVKPVFDPSTSSVVTTSMENVAKELEWRLNINAEDVDLEAPEYLDTLAAIFDDEDDEDDTSDDEYEEL